jgi:hypothetical protein
VLAAESRAQIGDRSFSQRQGLELVAAAPPQLEVRVELTFHPLNTYVSVPAYGVSLVEPGSAPVPPVALERLPRYGPRVDGATLPLPVSGGLTLPGGSQPMLGGAVVARFDARALNAAGLYDVVIQESDKELARVRANLEGMR